MKSGAPAFGTPEYAKATQAGAQLARRYRVPFRASSTNASNAVDAQAAYESEMSLWASVMAHTNIVNHAGGWLEGGLTASYEKLVIDAEMCQLLAEYLEPVMVDEDTLAVDAIAEVQPGGHFFGATHTLERYEDVFYQPIVSDWRNFETWHEAGAHSGGPACERDLEEAARGVRAAVHRSGRGRGPAGVRREAQARHRGGRGAAGAVASPVALSAQRGRPRVFCAYGNC